MASGFAFRINPEYGLMVNLFTWSRLRSEGYISYGERMASRFVLSRPKQSMPAIGSLGHLPIELLNEILMFLDLDSLRAVRQVNTFCFSLATGLPAYKLLREHASELLQIMHMTKTAGFFSIRELFAEFCQPQCRTCGNFGPYIFLLNCSRCCFNCLKDSDEYMLVPLFDVTVEFCLSSQSAKKLASIYTLPGRYGFPGGRLDRRRRRLVSLPDALDSAIEVHGSEQEMKEAAEAYREKFEEDYLDSVADWEKHNRGRPPTPYDDRDDCDDRPRKRKRKPPKPREVKVKPFTRENIRRWIFMGSAQFPFWNLQERVLEVGAYCNACVFAHGYFYPLLKVAERYTHRAYLIDELRQHFIKCRVVKEDNSRQYCNTTFHRELPEIMGKRFFIKGDGAIETPGPQSDETKGGMRGSES